MAVINAGYLLAECSHVSPAQVGLQRYPCGYFTDVEAHCAPSNPFVHHQTLFDTILVIL